MRIEAKNLTMQFNDAGRIIEVFRDLCLDVESGASLAVVGESGVGKTTLLYLLGMLESPVSGTVLFDGQDAWRSKMTDSEKAKFRGKSVGFIFQSHYLLPEFSALENVAMPLLIQRQNWHAASEAARGLLDRVGLTHRLTHRPGALSGGEQQRVAIARALVAGPGVVLADEPTGNIATSQADEVMGIFEDLNDQGHTIVMITHEPDIAEHAKRIIFIRDGQIVKDSINHNRRSSAIKKEVLAHD